MLQFNNCSLVVMGNWILEKSPSAFSGSSRLLAVHKKSVVEQGFLHDFAFDNTTLKTFNKFRICWKGSQFERCWIRTWTLSYPYYLPLLIQIRLYGLKRIFIKRFGTENEPTEEALVLRWLWGCWYTPSHHHSSSQSPPSPHHQPCHTIYHQTSQQRHTTSWDHVYSIVITSKSMW